VLEFVQKINEPNLNRLSSLVISSSSTRVRNKIKRTKFKSSILAAMTGLSISLEKFLQQLCCTRLLVGREVLTLFKEWTQIFSELG
jgi:hypothetical protein